MLSFYAARGGGSIRNRQPIAGLSAAQLSVRQFSCLRVLADAPLLGSHHCSRAYSSCDFGDGNRSGG